MNALVTALPGIVIIFVLAGGVKALAGVLFENKTGTKCLNYCIVQHFVKEIYILKTSLLYKVQCLIRISGTDKTDNLTCEIIYDNLTCVNYRFSNNHQS